MLKVRIAYVLLLVVGLLSFSTLFGQDSASTPEDRIFQDILSGSFQDVMADLVSDSSVNSRNTRGETPLMVAISGNQDRIARYFLARDPDLTIKNIDGNNALFLSIEAGNLGLVREIRQKMVKFDFFNDNGEGILEVAIRSQHYDVLTYLLEEKIVDVDRGNPLGFTALGFAAVLQDVQGVRVLLDHKADEDGRVGEGGKTPLMISAMLGDLPTMNFLLNARADTDLLDRYGRTALSIAVDASQSDAAKLLIAKRSDYDTVDSFGETPITLSIANGLDDVSISLINRGVNVNKGNDTCGETPVMAAAAFGRLRLLRYMLEESKGDLTKVLKNDCLEITSQDPYRATQFRKGWNALDMAEEAMQVDVVNYLVFSKRMTFNKELSPAKLNELSS